MIIEEGKEYRSRRGERVLITSVELTGEWPAHFVVLDGPYKGVGSKDGSRLRIDGRSTEPVDGRFKDHWNDLVAKWSDDVKVSLLPPAQSRRRQSQRTTPILGRRPAFMRSAGG
jgi:hypothetical protein